MSDQIISISTTVPLPIFNTFRRPGNPYNDESDGHQYIVSDYQSRLTSTTSPKQATVETRQTLLDTSLTPGQSKKSFNAEYSQLDPHSLLESLNPDEINALLELFSPTENSPPIKAGRPPETGPNTSPHKLPIFIDLPNSISKFSCGENSSRPITAYHRPRVMSDFCSSAAAPSVIGKCFPFVHTLNIKAPFTEHQQPPPTSPELRAVSSQPFQLDQQQKQLHRTLRVGQDESSVLRYHSGLLKTLHRKRSWHPSLDSPTDSGSDSPPPPIFDPVIPTSDATTLSSGLGSDDHLRTGVTQQPAERYLRFLGCTMNAGQPCDTVVWPTPDWTWIARPRERLKPLFVVEWNIGNISSIPIRFGVNESIVSPRFATTTDLQSIWISLTVGGPNVCQNTSSIEKQIPKNRATNKIIGNGSTSSATPTLDFPFSVKFTSTSQAMVKFGFLVGSIHSGPHTHLFRKSPWSLPKDFGRMFDAIGNQSCNEIKIIVEIYDVCFPDNIAPMPLAPSFDASPNSLSPTQCVTDIPARLQTDSTSTITEPLQGKLRDWCHSPRHSNISVADSLENKGLSYSGVSSTTEVSSTELISDILVAAAMHFDSHEAIKFLRLAVCLCQNEADPTDNVGFSPSSFFNGVRMCIQTHLKRQHNAAVAKNLRSLLTTSLHEIADADFVKKLLSNEQQQWILKAIPPRARADTLL